VCSAFTLSRLFVGFTWCARPTHHAHLLLQAKHSVCYNDGDKEELCLLTQFWKLKVSAPSALITSGLAKAGEMLYLKQLRPCRGRPAKGPSAKKLEGCRHLLSEGEAQAPTITAARDNVARHLP
jgi:hypothetical protein